MEFYECYYFERASTLLPIMYLLYCISASMTIFRLASLDICYGSLFSSGAATARFPLEVIMTQMGSKLRSLYSPSNIKESLQSRCRRVKEKSRHGDPADQLLVRLETARSTRSLKSTVYRTVETNTAVSGPVLSSAAALDELAVIDCIT